MKMYTNGIRLGEVGPIDEVNISRVHWDKELNQRYMRFRSTAMDLEEVARAYKAMGVRAIRLSVPLIKGAIDSGGKIAELIDRTERFVDAYVFRPLYRDTPDHTLVAAEVAFSDPRVEIDVGACSTGRDNPIWAADNRLYASWRLDPFGNIKR